MSQSVETLLKEAGRLLSSHSDSARLDAELLLAHVLGKSRTWLHTWPEQAVEAESVNEFQRLLQRRQEGEPVAHLLESQAFWTLQLRVTPDTLIPRPETELLVELALLHLPSDRENKILDLGTGTGAIALALAKERPTSQVMAVERSQDALAIARQNALHNHITNVEFFHGNWFEPLPVEQRFDLIASNPPYVPAGDPHLNQGDVRFEPEQALVAGKHGLDDLQFIIEHARSYLAHGGWLLVEHGYDQSAAVISLMKNAGFKNVVDHQDLAGQPRIITGQNP